MTPEENLQRLGIELPNVPMPIANFVPWQRQGNFLYLAGQVCEWNGEVVYKGKVGSEVSLDDGVKAARICGLNLIAALRQALGGSINSVKNCVRLGGFVNSDPEFPKVPLVINGASDLMHDVFGPEKGSHVRTAVGVAVLPQCASAEVDGIFVIE